jgi:hypothetical protein
MSPEISIQKVWQDEDVSEFKITVCNGYSVFTNKVYTSLNEIEQLIQKLQVFRNHLHGGLRDIVFGQFGREFANGAFSARLHFRNPSTLYISTHQQSDYFEFKGREEASECKMYLSSEPILLDNFIQELKILDSGINKVAKLECTSL